jgi:hypothetical protein
MAAGILISLFAKYSGVAKYSRRLVGGDGVAFGRHIKPLQNSAGQSGPLNRNGYLYPAPHRQQPGEQALPMRDGGG